LLSHDAWSGFRTRRSNRNNSALPKTHSFASANEQTKPQTGVYVFQMLRRLAIIDSPATGLVAFMAMLLGEFDPNRSYNDRILGAIARPFRRITRAAKRPLTLYRQWECKEPGSLEPGSSFGAMLSKLCLDVSRQSRVSNLAPGGRQLLIAPGPERETIQSLSCRRFSTRAHWYLRPSNRQSSLSRRCR
jgi:hypothetical protein